MKKQKINNILNVTIWIIQVFVSFTFISAGLFKLFQSVNEMAEMWPWVADHPLLVKVTGVFDLAGGLGLILPNWLKTALKFTVYAAVGCFVLMIAAIIFHLSRGEAENIGFNVLIAFLSGLIIWAREKNRTRVNNH